MPGTASHLLVQREATSSCTINHQGRIIIWLLLEPHKKGYVAEQTIVKNQKHYLRHLKEEDNQGTT